MKHSAQRSHPQVLRLVVPLALLAAAAAAAGHGRNQGVVPPTSKHAQPDVVPADTRRPVLDVLADGTLMAAGARLFRPDEPDEWMLANTWLRERAGEMKKERPAGVAGRLGELPAGSLLLRADRSAPFQQVQRVMERCGTAEVLIWKLQLTAALAPEAESAPEGKQERTEGRLEIPLPLDWGIEGEPLPMAVEVRIRVLDGGTKVARGTGEPWTGEADGVWDAGQDRRLVYQVGPYETGSLEQLTERLAALNKRNPEWPAVLVPVGEILVGDVVAVVDAILDAGMERFVFTGSPE